MTRIIEDGDSYSNETFFKILDRYKFKGRGRRRVLETRSRAESNEASASAYWNRDQKLLEDIRKEKHFRDRAEDAGEREYREQRIADLENQRAENKKTRAATDMFSTDFAARVSNELVKTLRSGVPIKDHIPALPENESHDSILIEESRAKINDSKKEIERVHRAWVSPSDFMARYDRIANNHAAAGAWDIGSALIEEKQADGSYRPAGPIRFPREHVSGESFVRDGFNFLYFIFKDEIRARMEKDVIAKSKGRKVIPLAERPKLIKRLESSLLAEERIEAGLFWRLYESGQTNISPRADMSTLAFLGLVTGRVGK